MVPRADTGPLYGWVWPILISVSVTPGPYFFSARATPDHARRETVSTMIKRSVESIISSPLLVRWAQSVADNPAHRHPVLVIEPHDLELIDRRSTSRAGVHLHPGQQQGEVQVFDAQCLPHEVLAREIVAALLDN